MRLAAPRGRAPRRGPAARCRGGGSRPGRTRGGSARARPRRASRLRRRGRGVAAVRGGRAAGAAGAGAGAWFMPNCHFPPSRLERLPAGPRHDRRRDERDEEQQRAEPAEVPGDVADQMSSSMAAAAKPARPRTASSDPRETRAGRCSGRTGAATPRCRRRARQGSRGRASPPQLLTRPARNDHDGGDQRRLLVLVELGQVHRSPTPSVDGHAPCRERTLAQASKRNAPADVSVRGRSASEEWWRWGRIELPVQNTFPGNFLQVFPANLRVRVAGPRPAGCFACYPVVPLGSLTPLTGVGDAAPPRMTSSPSGEGGRRRCSLLLSSEGVTIVASYSNCPLFYEACEQPRPAIPGSRALSKPDIPTNRLDGRFYQTVGPM